MNNLTISIALMALRPGAEWRLVGDNLSGLEWLDQEQLRPTDAEIINQIDHRE